MVATLGMLLVPAAPAAAHNSLRAASPAADARLTAPPARVTLEFLQTVDPAFTTIVLSDAQRRKVPTGDAAIAAATVTVPITGTLPNGAYTVAYRVVSADGHPVQGSYGFTVADPANPAAPAAAPPAASPAAPTAGPTGATRLTPLVVAGGALAAFTVAAVALVRRRRRRE
nr:copper resistance CopC family protein [Micromonospora sp. AMSO31t]